MKGYELQITSYTPRVGASAVRVVRVATEEGATMFGKWAKYIRLQKTIIPEMTQWCESNGINPRVENNTFWFDSEEDMMLFVMRWS